jgi:pimeloyl-ACP methyl ester carboxylesterase
MVATVTGSGPDVVLVHGSLGDYRQWQSIAEVLRTRYRVIAVSRRFHWPHAPAPDAHYSYEAQTDDLLGYLRALGRPVSLVGHSYGAGVALLAALGDPSRVHTLVLIEPALHSLLSAGGPAVDAEVASRSAMLAEVATLARAGRHVQAARALTDWIQGDAGGFDGLPPAVRTGLLENAATVGPTFSRAAPEVTCDDLRVLRIPTLVLNGERTRLYYRLIGERLASCLPGSTHQTITDAAHMTIVEQPAATAAILSTFLAGSQP